MKVVSVLFSNSPRTYDYLCPFDDVKVGSNVIVDTKRGEATVIVAEIKPVSDKATAHVKRVLPDEPDARDINTLF
jgi:hypothetical protein